MAVVVASQHPGLWLHRTDQTMHFSNMNMSGLMPAYDNSPRTVASPPTSRTFQPASSHMGITMPIYSTHTMTPVPCQSGPFAFDSMPVNPYSLHHTFPGSYPQTVPQTAAYNTSSDMQQMPTVREARNGFTVERTPPVKAESESPTQSHEMFSDTSYLDDCKRSTSEPRETSDASFFTDIDTLMRAIQAKQKPEPHADSPKEEESTTPNGPRRKYHCSIPDCDKTFLQRTHLDIHHRAHSGIKPYVCTAPACGQRFSQLGNLKTHERRHTGERPYKCDICGKMFAQKGNVRAHKIVHQQAKPFTCRLEDCGKQFTQLGNLKAHQNKFHVGILKYLTQKFASIKPGDYVSQGDKQLWEYFASLYKNSNKGIKGRGKDRRIDTNVSPVTSGSTSFEQSTSTSTGRNHAVPFQHRSSKRNSRCSSTTSDATQKTDFGYDFAGSMQGGSQNQHNGYNDDSVFPERKLY